MGAVVAAILVVTQLSWKQKWLNIMFKNQAQDNDSRTEIIVWCSVEIFLEILSS